MKTAYELAMERLNKSSPIAALTDKQKAEIAELDSRYRAKIAEHEISLQDRINKAAAAGDPESVAELERELSSLRTKLEAELEEKKERVRKPRKK